MSRVAIREPLTAAQRHLSVSTASPSRSPNASPFTSSLIANFDQEWTKLRLEDSKLPSNVGQSTSATMRVALNLAGVEGRVNTGTTFVQKPVAKQPPNGSYNLPLYSYKHSSPTPVLLYIRDEAEANDEVSKLKGPLGFDLEWRVLWFKGAPERKTAVLQLSDRYRILVIQLSAMKGFPAKVKAVVEAPDIIKMGVNISNDGRKLCRDYGILAAGLLELSHLAHVVDSSQVTSKRMISLKRIVEMYTGYTLDKGSVQTSNWEAKLTQKQLEYAANDAHSAVQVYAKLMKMAQDSGSGLVPAITPTGILELTQSISHEYRLRFWPGIEQPQGITPVRQARLGVVPVTSPDQYTASKRPVRGQLLRAYKLWHEEKMSLPEVCCALRSPEHPLAKSTVITYVVEALKADETLKFSRLRLRQFAKLDGRSWQRHGWWIEDLEKSGRGLED